MMILIVDDDLLMGTSLERMLRYTGHEAVAVPSGMEALSLLPLRRPQLILLDMQLPDGLDGLTILRAIRRDATFAGVPIWMYTADFSAEKVQEAMAAGAQDYLVKGTIGWNSLVERIDNLLRPKK